MKIFAIRDDELGAKDLAYLLYYEQSKSFYIEIPEDADVWELPMLLASFLQRGEYTVNAYWSRLWVQQRIVPADRQNLGMILKENNLKEYNEYKLLLLGKGRCAQDNCYIVPLEESALPQFFFDRHARKVQDVIPLADRRLLVFFRDGKVNRCDLVELVGSMAAFQPVIYNEEIFNTVSVSAGGYGIQWGEQLTISDSRLYDSGVEVGISLDDFKSFICHRVVSATEATELLQCSRQNLNALVRQNKLQPLKAAGRVTLFLKTDIAERSKGGE